MAASELLEAARQAAQQAQRAGANQVAVSAYRVRDVEVEWRDGKLEKISEATTRGLGVSLYVDGRYSTANTSDLRPDALARFLEDAVAMTKALAPDPFRLLPEPELYQGQSSVDLELFDARYDTVTPEHRRTQAQAMEVAARAVTRADAILSVTTGFSDRLAESARVHSNGFEGTRRETSFSAGADVSVLDADGRRPEDGWYVTSRFLAELPAPQLVGTRASERALARLGSTKPKSETLPMVLENRAAGGLVSRLLGPLSGAALQQKRSFLDGKVGQAVGSPLFSVTDAPLLKRGLGSRLFDGEGIAAKPMAIFEKGVLKSYYVDTYYGRKLQRPPTTQGTSNLDWALGKKGLAALLGDVKEGIYVTSFLGGNSNGTTGDFSLGVKGFRIRKGQLAEPVSELNVADNHLALWKKLVAVGDDPWAWSPLRTPTLVFDAVTFAGV
jgi:PmbA protein